MEAHASEEVAPLRARRSEPSKPSHVALRAHFRSNRSCQLFVKSGNHTQKWRHDDRNIVVPLGLAHQNAFALPTEDFNKPYMKKPSPGARELAEDVEPGKIDPRPPERLTRTGYDCPKR